MNLILFDLPSMIRSLYPLTMTRPACEIRVGILTIREKWEKIFHSQPSYFPEAHLRPVYQSDPGNDNLLVNGSLLPDKDIFQFINSLKQGECLVKNDVLIAARGGRDFVQNYMAMEDSNNLNNMDFNGSIRMIRKLWDIFIYNGEEIINDITLLKLIPDTYEITDPYTRVYGRGNLYLEENISIKSAIINAENGPVYIGKNVVINEGAIIRGPVAILERSEISMGAKIRENTTIGPYCKAGGEIKNSVFFGYSNKAHEGFVGNSVIGEWCNIGADTNCSNLKNNYSNVRVWDHTTRTFADSGLVFCGFFMGDHSKCGINTMINTGTIIGVSSNIFGTGFTSKMIPSFTWGGIEAYSTFDIHKAIDTANRMMQRRQKHLSDREMEILVAIYNMSASDRYWENQ